MTDEEPPPAPATSAENGPETYKVKVDHFEGIQMLGEENSLEGAPNFRQVLCQLNSNNSTINELDCWVSYFWMCPAHC